MAKALDPLPPGHKWDATHARHLLNRAALGVPLSAIPKLVEMGPQKAVGSIVNYDKFADNIVEPDFLTAPMENAQAREMTMSMTPDERRAFGQEQQRKFRQEVEQLKDWWLLQMRQSTRPLQEKMVLFWHGHFATSAQKVKEPHANLGLNQIFRTHATGNFKTLTFEVGKSPAMLRYLDNNQNRKGRPNENWARELMELFTMGIGNYTEEDIKEAARAFSGYSDTPQGFRVNQRQHDYGEKTFLGKTGTFDGADIINIIFEQPVTARFISRKLWEFFVYENPSEELVEDLAATLRENDYELKPLLTQIFLSREFHGERAMAGQIKSPAQYLIMLMDQLQTEPMRKQLVSLAMRGLGQDLFFPPNVKGWPGNRAWINTNTLLMRYNIPTYVLMGHRPNMRADLRLDEMAERNGGAANPNARQRAGARENAKLMDLRKLYRQWEGKPAGQVADGLAAHFLGRPLDGRQREAIADVLTPGTGANTPITEVNYDNARAVAAVHLLLSMAEYQLC